MGPHVQVLPTGMVFPTRKCLAGLGFPPLLIAFTETQVGFFFFFFHPEINQLLNVGDFQILFVKNVVHSKIIQPLRTFTQILC